MNIQEAEQSKQTNTIINLSVRLIALGLIFFWCFLIIAPFINLAAWAIVLAVTLYPFHEQLTKVFKGGTVWAASVIVVLLLLIMIVPGVWFLFSSVDEVKALASQYREGLIAIPPPEESVKGWPVIGNKVYEFWTQASTDLSKIVSDNRESLKPFLIKLFSALASTGKGLLLLAGSIILSGVFLSYADASSKAVKALFTRLAGSKGETMASISEVTIRNVAKGILGVSVIQSTLAGIGFVLAGIPAAGLWVVVCLILSIVQVGIIPVTIGTIIYIWNTADTLTATLFTIWMLVVGISDNILKPIMLGKGAPVPMLAVLIGSIGGFIHSGFIGLFTGAIILSLGYKLFEGWLTDESQAG